MLTSAWFADRALGRGKILLTGTPGAPTPVGGPVGTPGTGPVPGPTYPPGGPSAPLPEPGAPISPPPLILANGMTGAGFDGTAFLHGLPLSSTHAVSFSLSCWLDFNALLAPLSFTPDINAGFIFNTKYNYAANDGCAVEVGPTWAFLQGGGFFNYGTPNYPLQTALGTSFPARWVHFMLSMDTAGGYMDLGGGVDTTATRVLCYINDTQCVDTTIYMSDNGDAIASYFDASGADSNTDTTYWDANEIGASRILDPGFYDNTTKYYINGTSYASPGTVNYSSDGLKAGVTELWLAWNHFIDWSVSANRKLFHNTDGTTFIPCSLGLTGSRPLGSAPLIYMTGNAHDFPYNRAKGNALATVVGTLLDVADGFV